MSRTRGLLSLTSIAIRSYDEYPSRGDGRREEFALPRIESIPQSAAKTTGSRA